MLASDNPYIEEASNTIFQLSADEQIRKQCLDREEYYREIRTYKKIIVEKESLIAEQNSLMQKAIAEKDSCIAEQDSIIQHLSAELEKLKTDTGK